MILRNIKNRTFNGIKKGGLVNVDTKRAELFLRNGFIVIEEKKNNIKKTDEEVSDEEVFDEDLIAQYEELFGKKPHPNAKLETIKKKIAEHK